MSSKLKRLSSRFVSFLFLAVASLIIPSKTQAAIGTHLGVGDPGHQMSIMDIIAANGGGPGFPITIMMDAGIGADTIQQFANKTKEYGFFPIVRINYVCDNSRNPIGTAISVKQIFDATLGAGSGNYIITFGNEVNNASSDQVGCTNPTLFATNYNNVAGLGSNISPSALDWYNSDYPAQNFLNSTGLGGAYGSAPVRTANAYGCIGETTESCLANPSAYGTWTTGTQGISQPLYITEFSLSPGGSNPPDMDLANVINFIQTVGPSTGAIQITPLVRNVCSNLLGEGEWLLYINGNLFTSIGTPVDPTSCVATNPSDTFTPRDRDDYFIYPLNLAPDTNWTTGATPLHPRTNEILYNLAYDQGYQVSCPSEKISIEKKVIDAIDRYFEIYDSSHPPPLEMGGNSTFQASTSNAKVPLYRGNEALEQTQKASSFEGYFGALNLTEPNPMVGSGVLNNVLSLEQQCNAKFAKGLVVNELCQKLENPTACALKKKITNTNLDPEELYWAMEGYLHLGNNKLNCRDWTLPWETLEENRPLAAANVGQEKFEEIQTAIQNMPITPDLSYKMAYLVITPLQNKEDGSDPFWFLANKDKNSPNHAPIFLGFKIPDTLTNRSYSASFTDAAKGTSDALKEVDAIEEEYNNEVGRREGTLNNIATAQIIRIQNLGVPPESQQRQIINCGDMPRCKEGNEDVPLYLREALLDMINGEGNACDGGGGVVEDAGEIFSYGVATKKGDGSRTFNTKFLDGIVTQSGDQPFDWGLKINDANEARGNFINPANNPENSATIPVMVHLVAPLGSNLNSVQEGLWALFNTRTRELTEGDAPDYYPLKGIQIGFSDTSKHEFWDPDIDCGQTVDEDGNPVSNAPCNNNSFTIRFTDEDSNKSTNYPGAKIGWMIKKIQEGFNTLGSVAYDYVLSCETTEDMFLGRCAGGSSTGGSSSSTTTAPTSQNQIEAILNGEDLGGWGPNRCSPFEGTNHPCDINSPIMIANFPDEINRRNASVICRAESGGDPTTVNKSCISPNPEDWTGDYSIGLFQVNLVIQNRCPGGIASYNSQNGSCTVGSQGALDACEADLLIPENNIEWAANNSGHGKYWAAWSTSQTPYCGNYLIQQ